MKPDKPLKYTCPKCGNRDCEIGEVRTTSTFLTKIFDIQNRRFTSVTCTRCKYTELFSVPTGMIGNVFDFFVG